MDEGALTYITKNSTREELKLAIEKASRGEFFYFGQPEAREQKTENNEILSKSHNLTPVQTEIINLLSERLSHKEISGRLGISRSFIEKILSRLRTSFRVKNNLELISLLLRKGSF